MTIGDNAKRCTKCGDIKQLEEFGRHRSMPDGRTSRCRECCAEDMRLWRAANPEATRQTARRYRAANPEAERERKRRLRQANPESNRERACRWRAANPEAEREAKQRRHATNREAVFSHYGRECACCGSAQDLTIDHINGNGREHRMQLFGSIRGGGKMYRWLIRSGFPEGFQTLCFPCNRSKRDGQHCRLDHAKAA